jgi:hypothetical protein
MRTALSIALVTAAFAAVIGGTTRTAVRAQSNSNTTSDLRTISSTGSIDRRNAFFRPLGKQYATTCEHCHFASDGWGVSADHIRQLFNSSQGKHPIFTPPSANDFHAAVALANDANADRQSAYSLLLDKGDALVRRNFDANAADFTIVAVVDPSLPAGLHSIAIDEEGRIVH